MGHPSPTSLPCQSDDENEGCNNSGPSHSNDVVQALLGMAATHTQPLNLGMYSENNGEDGDDEYGWSEHDVAQM